MKAVLAKDVGAAYAYPIVWRDALCGVVAFGFAKAMPFSAEEQTQVQEAAARLGVAISSAWRDAQLYKQAHYDSLTGLPNRLLLVDRLSQEIVRCQRESTRCALLFIDLDHFKKVNDTQGHSSGDAVLVETARRLAQCVRACDTIARLGGDEFTITFTQLSNPRRGSPRREGGAGRAGAAVRHRRTADLPRGEHRHRGRFRRTARPRRTCSRARTPRCTGPRRAAAGRRCSSRSG